jgi:hypothetical protein
MGVATMPPPPPAEPSTKTFGRKLCDKINNEKSIVLIYLAENYHRTMEIDSFLLAITNASFVE